MISIKKLSLAALAAASISTTAHATMITNTWDPSADITVTSFAPYGFIHDINDQLNALTPSGDIYQIDSAELDVYLKDPRGGNEKFTFLIGSGDSAQIYTVPGNNNVPNGSNVTKFPVTLTTSIEELQLEGLLSVVLAVNPGGNYIFDKSILSTMVSFIPAPDMTPAVDPSNNVPEPGTVTLFGLGLLGVVLGRRKKA